MPHLKAELMKHIQCGDLMRGSLCLAQIEDPSYDMTSALDQLMAISSRAWTLSHGHRGNPASLAQTVSSVLFSEHEFQSSPDRSKRLIDDPQRYLLHHVLDKKLASPLAAAILYSIVATQVGLSHEVVSLPWHYFIRVQTAGNEFFIDAFDRGRAMNSAEFQRRFRSALQKHRMMQANIFERVSIETLISRTVGQLKHVYILKGKAIEALQTVELLTAIHPDTPEYMRDRGVLYCEMEYFTQAVADLRFYIKKRPFAEDVGDIKKLASMLKGYREIVN